MAILSYFLSNMIVRNGIFPSKPLELCTPSNIIISQPNQPSVLISIHKLDLTSLKGSSGFAAFPQWRLVNYPTAFVPVTGSMWDFVVRSILQST